MRNVAHALSILVSVEMEDPKKASDMHATCGIFGAYFANLHTGQFFFALKDLEMLPNVQKSFTLFAEYS
jgi:hypothetical protein